MRDHCGNLSEFVHEISLFFSVGFWQLVGTLVRPITVVMTTFKVRHGDGDVLYLYGNDGIVELADFASELFDISPESINVFFFML